MLSVIAVILKTVGIVLLVLLAALLLLLGLVLFVPVRYSGRGRYEEAPSAEVRVSWLLKLIRFRLNYENGIDAEARLGPLKLWSMKTGAAGEETGLPEELPEPETQGEVPEEGAFEIPAETSEEPAEAPEVSEAQQEEALETAPPPEEIPEEEKPRRKREKEYTGTPETIDEKFEKLMNRVYGVKDKIDEGLAFLNEESTRRLIALLKRILFRLLREICPGEYGGEVRFGFEDPFTTGQVCSAFALLYPFYRDRIRVVPWFDREELFADLSVKGRIRLFIAAFAAAQIWFSRDFQKVFKRFRNRNKMMEVSHG